MRDRAGVEVKIVKQAIKEAREARDGGARAARAALEPPDHRTVLPAPAKDAEIGAVAETVDALMATSKAEEPALRGRSGKLVRIVEEPVPGMHLLTARGANAEPPPTRREPPPVASAARAARTAHRRTGRRGAAGGDREARPISAHAPQRTTRAFVRLEQPFCESGELPARRVEDPDGDGRADDCL